jgi:NADH:ubiquinone oxidoreductase subunit 5 (subunit L)/multisubunit Na+/H+ antiporter MnhA subunit
LAYSTISHIGFILLALAVNTEQSIDSFIFYIIQYTITNLNIFLVILGLTYCLSTNSAKQPLYSLSDSSDSLLCSKAVGEAKLLVQNLVQSRGGQYSPNPSENPSENPTAYLTAVTASCSANSGEGLDKANKDISFISEFKGLFFSNPLLSLSLAVSLFSMAGIPPLIGFFSKQLVLYSALQNGYYFISVLAIIVSVISCSYYLQIIKVLLTKSTSFSVGAEQSYGAAAPRGEQEASCFALGCKPGVESQLWQFLVATQREVYSQARGKNEIILTNTHSYLISTLTFTILLFFIKPSLILNSTQLLSLSLFYI